MILRSASVLAPILRLQSVPLCRNAGALLVRRGLATERPSIPQYISSATIAGYEENTSSIPAAFRKPPILPKTHNIPCAVLHLRSHHTDRLALFSHFTLHAAHAFGIPVSHPSHLPTKRTLITVLKSPFVHKGAQENFQELVHKRAIKIWDVDATVLSQFVRYLQVNAIAGVGIKVIKWERKALGFGSKMMERAVSDKRPTAVVVQQQVVQQQVKAMADAIIKEEMRVAGLHASAWTGGGKSRTKAKPATSPPKESQPSSPHP